MRYVPGVKVEVKIELGDADGARVEKAMRLDAGERRDVVFFDTPELTLYARGVVLRARRVHGHGDDVAVKVPGATPVPAGTEQRAGFKREVDRTESAAVVTTSLTEHVKGKHIEAVVARARPVRSLFTDAQRALADTVLGAPGVPWDALAVLGPVSTTVWKPAKAPGLALPAALERWRIPGGDLVEISARVDEKDADAALKSLEAFVVHHGAKPLGREGGKTRAALDALTAAMREPP